ncbi:hypothetical protein D5R40_10515 [Okeania hirsuta]|uniref:Uncharacterized protein n=1 Tax=Okeania hirsuta TaxID=1458930 RepID=A0A3N6QMG8_9CYAN|nr:hypothetical protein [Okeania hirsuta]RQH45677.1 hypothetical protein D5R40_10515 [Okeania hirsuta]
MFVKGIKKGKIIELLEEVDFPDNQEVLVEIKKVSDFLSALQDFRTRVISVISYQLSVISTSSLSIRIELRNIIFFILLKRGGVTTQFFGEL